MNGHEINIPLANLLYDFSDVELYNAVAEPEFCNNRVIL